MRSFLSRKASPGTAISLVALFVALSGTAVALPGKNRVDSNDPKRGSIGTRAIANNSIRSGDIRTGNVQSSDVKDDSVTGGDVDESSLGKVPSATSADSATNAASAANAGALDGVDSTGFLRTGTRARQAADDDQDTNYTNDATRVQLSNVAGGQYVVTAKIDIDNDTAADELIDCDLVQNAAVLVTSEQDLGAANASAQELTYTMTQLITTSAAGTDDLSLRCEQAGADNDSNRARIVAHKVD